MSTNVVLTKCAQASNHIISLFREPRVKCRRIPLPIKKQSDRLLKILKTWKLLKNIYSDDNPIIVKIAEQYRHERTKYRQLVRRLRALDSYSRDLKLMNLPTLTYASIRRSKRKNDAISSLTVGDVMYSGDAVKDGFYESIRQLKMKNTGSTVDTRTETLDLISDYSHIVQLCKTSNQVPLVSEHAAFEILSNMKMDVMDFYSITPSHYINAGIAGYKHFHILLNSLLSDLNNTTLTDVNRAHAVVLFKGHGKDKSSSKSYRTISTCPVVAKGLDLYIRKLCGDD